MVSQSDHKNVILFSDSLSALEAIAGRYIGHPELMEFVTVFTTLKREGVDIVLAWVPGHVGIRGNEMADILAKNATSEEMARCFIPYTDCKPRVQSYVGKLWQEDWNSQSQNKLFQIRPDLREHLPQTFTNRKEETVLCRLHTGHTSITHAHLLKGEEAPSCVACDEPLTVKHFVIDCWDLYEIRRKHFTADSMKILFRDVPPWTIIEFFKECNLFYKI
jgi:hypothetical protein